MYAVIAAGLFSIIVIAASIYAFCKICRKTRTQSRQRTRNAYIESPTSQQNSPPPTVPVISTLDTSPPKHQILRNASPLPSPVHSPQSYNFPDIVPNEKPRAAILPTRQAPTVPSHAHTLGPGQSLAPPTPGHTHTLGPGQSLAPTVPNHSNTLDPAQSLAAILKPPQGKPAPKPKPPIVPLKPKPPPLVQQPQQPSTAFTPQQPVTTFKPQLPALPPKSATLSKPVIQQKPPLPVKTHSATNLEATSHPSAETDMTKKLTLALRGHLQRY